MSPVLQGLLFGLIAGVPLLVGAWLALRRSLPSRFVGLVAAFGAGALLSAVSYELVLDAFEQGSPLELTAFVAAGAIVYYLGDLYLERRGSAGGSQASRGLALLMGAALDGIPESFILGISVAAGEGVSIAFLVAVVVSNLPEGMSSAAELVEGGFSRRRIMLMWAAVAALSAAVAAFGAFVGQGASATGAAAQAFAAGALLTMLVDDLIPEARERGGIGAGLVGVLGFAVAFALHTIG